MKKNIITNKITPCCGLPYSVIYWWVTNLKLNSESDRQFILSKISQGGVISIDAWKILINSGVLENDSPLTKNDYLEWFACERQPTCEQLKLIIEGFKIGNWTPETELPQNLALIDKFVNGQNLNGNVYTKEQVNQLLTTSFGGDLVVSDNPQPTSPIWYFAKENGTYANAGGLVVDLSGKLVVLNYDGTTWSKVEVETPKGEDGKTIENYSDKAWAKDSQVFYNGEIFQANADVLAGENPSNSSKWTKVFSNILQDVSENYGRTLLSGYYQSSNLSGVYYIGNANPIVGNGTVTEVSFYIQIAATVNLAIGKISNNIFVERKVLSLSGVAGLNTIIINEALTDGETFMFKTPLPLLGYYQGSGSIVGVYSSSQNGSLTAAGGEIPFRFKVNKSVSLIEQYLFSIKNQQSFGNTTTNIYYTTQLNGIQYVGNDFYFATDKIITEIKADFGIAGTAKMAIGSIDQWGKFIERKELSFPNIVVGVNKISLNEKLNANERILFKTPFLNIGVDTNGSGAYKEIYFNANGGTRTDLNFSIAYQITVGDMPIVDSTISETITELRGQIATLSVKKDAVLISPNGTYYKLAVTNAGQIVTQSMIFDKILHLGNSLSWHSLQSYWWGEWGMAASQQSKDYVHRFLAKMQTKFPSAQTWVKNIATWEQNFDIASAGIDLSMNPNLIVIRLGENVNNGAGFQNAFNNLITYLQNNAPQATILIGGIFWANSARDAAMSTVAVNKGLTFVHLSDLDISENKAKIGDLVYGNDGQQHSIDNQGVANHPNDLGMERIAQRLFNALGL